MIGTGGLTLEADESAVRQLKCSKHCLAGHGTILYTALLSFAQLSVLQTPSP